ncbi:unnamed protein product [Closterium sp. NIES-53]
MLYSTSSVVSRTSTTPKWTLDYNTDLITHLRTSDTRYRAALPAEDHFISPCPTTLTADLLEERLLAAETSITAVGASCGDPRSPFFEGCSPVPLLPSIASAAAVDLVGTESVSAASAPSERRRTSKSKRGEGAGGGGGGCGSGGRGGGGGGGGGGSGWQPWMQRWLPGSPKALMVKRPPGSPPVFKARYVARGFSQRQGVDYFQTFSPTPKMTTLRVLLHVAAQRNYELQSLDFSTAFLQGSLHEEIWLRRPPGLTRSEDYFAALGFAPSTADPSLFLRIDTLLPPFYILVYVDDLVFATAETAGLAHVKSELQKRHTCTDLGELHSYLGLQITRDRAQLTITLTQSHMVQQVLQRFDFTYSSPQATPLSTRHSLSALPSDESVEPNGPHRPEHMAAAKRVLRYLCCTSGLGLVLGGRSPVVLTGHADASWVDDLATQQSSQGYTFSLGFGFVSWRSTRSSSVLRSSCEAEIYAGAMAAQELRWLTYLLIDLGEPPRSPPVLYVDNKAMLVIVTIGLNVPKTKDSVHRRISAQRLQTLIAVWSQLQMT